MLVPKHTCSLSHISFCLDVEEYFCTGEHWFGLFVHPFSHIGNTGHVNYRLQFTTCLV